MRKLILSASSISAYKACPTRFKNAYVYGIRPIEDKESQRIGTSWHTVLEVASLEPGSECPECEMNAAAGDQFDPHQCIICTGTGKVPDDIMEAVVRVLNRAYAEIEFNDVEKKEIERLTLLYALMGYRWHYGDKIEPTVVREQYFSLPLLNPDTGHPVPNVFLNGKIDKLINIAIGLAVKEHKSTSKSIDPDSTYWGHLNLDTQTSMYVYAARRMQIEDRILDTESVLHDPLINTVKYDVYHKPQISPRKLTQADSKKFVTGRTDEVKGDYMGQEFSLALHWEGKNLLNLSVNSVRAEIEPGKKEGTFAIRETPEMFAARFLKDITERPEFYFRCVELTRTDAEMKAFEYELYDIAKDMQSKIRANRWWTNEHQCEATFRCDYIEQCYNHTLVDPDHIPDGFKCIFNRKENE